MLGKTMAFLSLYAVKILGVALVSTVLYASYLTFVRLPIAKASQERAEVERDKAQLLVKDAALTNKGLSDAAKLCSESVKVLADAGQVTKEELGRVLQELSRVGAANRKALAAYVPDPTKTACENAEAELAKFRMRRGQ